jgi:sugar lactone lactonase YvrE
LRYCATVTAVALLFTGCSGGTSPNIALPAASPATAPQATKHVNVTLSIAIPAASTSQVKRPAYVSSATQSATAAVTQGGGSAGAPTTIDCNTTALTCSGTVSAPVGSDTFVVNLYSGTNGSGSLLSTGTATQTIVAGQANSVSLTFDGVVASIVASFPNDPHISGSQSSGYTIVGAAPYTLTVSALDASGETIVGPGAPTLGVSSASSDIVVVAGASANTYTVHVAKYSASPVTLTVAPAAGTAGIASAPVAVTAVQELWVANQSGNDVTAYSLAGTPSQIAADTITAGVDGPDGVALDASGNLWVGNFSGGNVTAYSLTGTPSQITGNTFVPPPAAGILPTYQPGLLGLDGSGNLWVSNLALSSSVSAYNILATPSRITAYTIGTGDPTGIAFDASGNIWFGSLQNNSVTAFSLAGGTPSAIAADTITAGINFPYGIAFDANGNLWVANSGNSITAYNVLGGSPSQISADTISSGLDNPNGIAFDAAGNLWVANAGNNSVTAYSVSGTPSQIAADTITTALDKPMALVISP